MWQWKTFLTTLGALLSLAAAVIPTLYGVVWWITATAVLVLGALLIVQTGNRVHIAEVFQALSYGQKSRVITLCRLAVGAYALWTLVYVVHSVWWPYMLVVLPFMGMAIYWTAKSEEYRILHTKPTEKVEPTSDESFENRKRAKLGRDLLDAAGHPRVRVIGHAAIVGENSWESGDQFTVQVPPTGMGR